MAIRWSGEISRQCVLSIAAGAAAILGTVMPAAAAKLSQGAAQYRNRPKGRQHCDNCALFRPPSSCRSVKGPISSQGWCELWVRTRA